MIHCKLTQGDYKQAYKQLYMPWLRIFAIAAALSLGALVFFAIRLAASGSGYIVSVVLYSLLTAFFVAYPLVISWSKLRHIKGLESDFNVRFSETELTYTDCASGEQHVYANEQVKFIKKNKYFIYLQLPEHKELFILPNTYDADLATAPYSREATVQRAIDQQNQKPLYAAGIALAVLSFLAAVAAFVIALIAGKTYLFGTAGMRRTLWVALCFLPLPVAAIVLGSLQRRLYGGSRSVAVIALGIVAAVLLIEIGATPLKLDKDTFTRANVTAVEQRTGLTFPRELQVACNGSEGCREINAFVPEAERAAFTAQLVADSRWTNDWPEQLKKTMPNMLKLTAQTYTHFACYNETTGEFNGECSAGDKCVYACYDIDRGTLYIIYDYTVPALRR